MYGLGDLFDPAKVATTLQSMYAINFKPRLADVVNPCRVFGLEDESGAVVCDWPPGAVRPVIPVPYSQETFHGLEYSLGSMLMHAGEIETGLRVFRAVRDRYRGDNRNPWNEMECGSNYVRSMASYAGLLALSGFGFDLDRRPRRVRSAHAVVRVASTPSGPSARHGARPRSRTGRSS